MSKIAGKSKVKRIYDNEGNLISKECTRCHEIKPVSEFNKHKRHSDGLHSKCKECRKKYHQENKDRDNERRKKHYQENKDKIKEYNKKHYQENKDYYKEYKKTYNQENKEEIREYSKKHYQENKEHYKKYRQENKDKIKKYRQEYCQKNKEYKKEYDKEYNDKKVQQALQQIKIEVESSPDKYNHIEGKEIYGIIYLVHNVKTNRYYVGQTTIGFDNRYNKGWLYENGRKNDVKHDLELYGENSFEYTKLFKVAHSQYELDKLEAYYIDYYDSYENGYNENRGNIFTNRGKEK